MGECRRSRAVHVSTAVRLHRRPVAASALALAVAMAAPLVAGASSAVTAPANDTLANAQVIHSLPATLEGTTAGATVQPEEAASSCGVSTTSSVWYSLRAQSVQRIAVDLAAGGALDGTIDVYHAVRSQLQSVACQQTDSAGKASLTFKTSKNGLYEIRVAALQSQRSPPSRSTSFCPRPKLGRPGGRCRRAASTGRSTASRMSTPPTPSRCVRASAT